MVLWVIHNITLFIWRCQYQLPWCIAVTTDSFPVCVTYGVTTASSGAIFITHHSCNNNLKFQEIPLKYIFPLLKHKVLIQHSSAGGDSETVSKFFILSGSRFPLHHSHHAKPSAAATTEIVLSDSDGNAASAGPGCCQQEYNMICEHVNTSWIKQCSLHAPRRAWWSRRQPEGSRE